MQTLPEGSFPTATEDGDSTTQVVHTPSTEELKTLPEGFSTATEVDYTTEAYFEEGSTWTDQTTEYIEGSSTWYSESQTESSADFTEIDSTLEYLTEGVQTWDIKTTWGATPTEANSGQETITVSLEVSGNPVQQPTQEVGSKSSGNPQALPTDENNSDVGGPNASPTNGNLDNWTNADLPTGTEFITHIIVECLTKTVLVPYATTSDDNLDITESEIDIRADGSSTQYLSSDYSTETEAGSPETYYSVESQTSYLPQIGTQLFNTEYSLSSLDPTQATSLVEVFQTSSAVWETVVSSTFWEALTTDAPTSTSVLSSHTTAKVPTKVIPKNPRPRRWRKIVKKPKPVVVKRPAVIVKKPLPKKVAPKPHTIPKTVI